MKFRFFSLFSIALMVAGCANKKETLPCDDLNSVKKEFLMSIFSSEVDEGPFHMNYELKTVFFSKDLLSLVGKLYVYDCLPHGGCRYEGKTFVKINGKLKEISLDDLFTTASQKEFLRSCCEEALKKNPLTYFAGENPLQTKLELKDIRTFVVDEQSLTIILQSYVAASSTDGPCVIKIPLKHLDGHWDLSNILVPLLQKNVASKQFISWRDTLLCSADLHNEEQALPEAITEAF